MVGAENVWQKQKYGGSKVMQAIGQALSAGKSCTG